MIIRNKQNSPSGQYDGFFTCLFIGEETTGSKEISIQLTEVLPGKMQTLHKHSQTQCYYVVEGEGRMIIDTEEEDVSKGDTVFIPGDAVHGIINNGYKTLIYLTANQAFGVSKEKEIWFREPNT